MDRKNYTIGILSLTAVVMTVGMLFAPNSTNAAPAGVIVRDRDYTMVTAQTQGGGDALYILDNRRGILGIFTFDNATRGLRYQGGAPVSNAFKGPGAR